MVCLLRSNHVRHCQSASVPSSAARTREKRLNSTNWAPAHACRTPAKCWSDSKVSGKVKLRWSGSDSASPLPPLQTAAGRVDTVVTANLDAGARACTKAYNNNNNNNNNSFVTVSWAVAWSQRERHGTLCAACVTNCMLQQIPLACSKASATHSTGSTSPRVPHATTVTLTWSACSALPVVSVEGAITAPALDALDALDAAAADAIARV